MMVFVLKKRPFIVQLEVLGEYTCVKKTVVRVGFEMDSEKATGSSILKKGSVIVAVEAKTNDSGILRVRFGLDQWVSTMSSAGDVILEKMPDLVLLSEQNPTPAKPKTAAAAGEVVQVGFMDDDAETETKEEAAEEEEVIGAYTVVLASVVRAGFAMDTAKLGTVKKGEEVLCYEERENEKGVTRVRFGRGWVSLTSSDGATILEPVE